MAGIAASAPHKPEAMEFLRWVSRPDIQIRYARAGGMPHKLSAFKDEEARARFPYLGAALEALTVGVASPRISDWSKVEDILGTELNKALLEKGNAKQHLDAATAEATAFLKNAGYYAE
jgi:multiple sugar transport system substrate-binding protein